MKKPTALIFGHRGGIGSATKSALIKFGCKIISVDRTIIDFNHEDADEQIQSFLKTARPDIIVNCTGIFKNGYKTSHTETMNVNFGSNWSIIRHYMNPQNQTQATRIIMLGSSSYSGGRKLYPLYSASKAALYNLWQGARDVFEGSLITVDLINPVRTLTKMSSAGKSIDPTLDYLHPDQVAEEVVKLIEDNAPSTCVDINFKEPQ